MSEQGLTTKEVLGESLATYVTLEDALLIRNTFKDNPRLLRVLQKIFIPTIQDPEMTPESMGADSWMDGKNWDAVPVDEIKALVVARQDTIKQVMGGLIRIKTISNVSEESLNETAQRRIKDSTK